MKFYMAPMEGVTTHVFREAYHSLFRPADKYFTPFLVPHINKTFSEKEWQELNPENNKGMVTVPQILTCQADDFVRTAKHLKEYGYREVNLNLGCPSKTVVTKGRGSGFLEDPRKLDRFFDEVFEKLDMEVSVKTRLGLESPLEFEDIFGEALASSRHSICYNGDLFSKKDFESFQERFPQVEMVMLGRGIVAHPDLINELCAMEHGKTEQLQLFHQRLLEGYCRTLSGDRNILFKMKEFWSYFVKNFSDEKKVWKKIKKCERLSVYEAIVDEIFQNA